MRPWMLLWLAVGCDGSEADPTPDEPVCDGRLQPGESSVDSPWDRDGDGYFDFSNLFCAETYGLNRFDCDDDNPSIHVDAVEIICNGVDDDCNFATADGDDVDGDGATHCIDCDDTDDLRSPLLQEVCWDDIDNDCDGVVDPGCGPDYNGVFEISVPIHYECDGGLVDLDIVEFEVVWEPPNLTVIPGSMFPAIEMEGTIDKDGEFRAQLQLDKDCNQKYGVQGTFTSEDTFIGEFRTNWGRNTCEACAQPFAAFLSGTKVIDDKKTKPTN